MDPSSGTGSQPVALVVEDDAPTRLLYTSTLRERGFRAFEAADGAAALALLGAHRIDVVILDLALAGRSGEPVLQKIRSAEGWPDTAVVVVTGHAAAETRTRVQREADAFLAKPCPPAELLSVVLGVLRARGRPTPLALPRLPS